MTERKDTTRESTKVKFKHMITGDKSLVATILLIILIIICLIAAYIGCNRITFRRAYSQLDDAANTVIDQIRSKFQRDGEILDSTAQILSTSDAFYVDLGVEDEAEKEQALQEFREKITEDIALIKPFQKLMNLRIYTPSCDVFLPDDGLPSFTIQSAEYDGLIKALDRDRTVEDSRYGTFVSSRFESQRNGMEGVQIVGQYVPVVRNDKIVAVLCGVTILSDFPSLLRVSNIYNSNADVAIVDVKSENYEMIMDTMNSQDDNGKPIENFKLGNFSDFEQRRIRGWKSVDEFKNDLVAGNQGSAQIWSDRDDEWAYVYYAPVGGVANRWSVMISVPMSVAFSNVQAVQIVFTIIGVVLTIALVFYFLWIRKNSKETMKKTVERAVLEERLHKAEAAERAKTTFLSNMSHDIRTPMNAILGYTTLAETNIDNKERVQDYLNKILSSGNHLLSLINDILDMSRIESGKLNIEEKPCSISDIFRDMRNIIQTQMKGKQLNFFMDTLDIVDEDIYCDKLHVNQILLNLLSNSIKFTPAGGSVSLTIKQKSGAPTGYGAYEIRVKDTGIGMSEEFAKHIFEPFERERTSTVSGIQGTGLGMAITKNIVDTMGGTIEVKTEKDKGTEFIIELQFRLQNERKHPQVIRELDGLRALVVDDNFTTCDSISKMLMTIGMRSEWTMHGKEAVLRTQQAKDIGDEFSVYIIDWVMPDLSGFEIVRQIRKIVGDNVPIIIVTAYDITAIMDEAKDIGVTAYCNKPIFLSDLRDTLRSCISSSRTDEKVSEKTLLQQKLAGKRILLVEDNELNREIAQEILVENGFEVETAEDGTIAVEKVKSSKPGYYDLVLMDVQMPIMNGYDATKAIRSLDDEGLKNIPIVAMTANAFDEDRRKAMESGMNDHVPKPFNVENLLSKIQKYVLPPEDNDESDENA